MASSLRILAVLATQPLVALAGHSISSCGGPSDVLKNVVLELTPDPVEKGQTMTFTASGDLGEVLASGSALVDVDVKVSLLGHQIINKKVNDTYTFGLQPGVPSGHTLVKVGPVALPKVPGTVDVSGKIVLKDGKGAQVTCVALDGHISALGLEEAAAPAVEDSAPEAFSSCAKSSDHLHDASVTKSGDEIVAQGTLDEFISSMSFDADITLHAGFIPVPVKLSVPVSYTPGLMKGQTKLTVSGPMEPAPKLPFRTTGTVSWKDAAAQEIYCISLGSAAASLII